MVKIQKMKTMSEMGNPQPSSNLLKMGCIYMITFPSNKKYIGQTTRDVTKRISEHRRSASGCTILKNAVAKYGSFEWEVLLNVNDHLLDAYETRFIDVYKTVEPFGYNIRCGGSAGNKHSNESRKRMQQAKLGENNPNYGLRRTDKAKAAISAAKSGDKHHFFGKTFNDDHKHKLSQSHKIYDASLPMYVSYVMDRPAQYQSEGYAVANHPMLKNKYFTSKKFSLDEKLKLALEYLNSAV